MRFEDFERRARQLWREIPEEYKEGIDGVVVSREALPHPTLPEIYTLGECVTEAYPSDFGGPDTIRSVVMLYWGSFRKLARLDEAFDWDDELWETLTHELQHHLESLASEDALEGLDYAADEHFKRMEGEPFEPFYYRSGQQVAPGVWRVEREFFLEQEYAADREPAPWIGFSWHGTRYRVTRPAELGDVCFLWIESGIEETGPAEVTLVLVRRRGWLHGVRSLFAGRRPVVVEAQAEAEAQAKQGQGGGEGEA